MTDWQQREFEDAQRLTQQGSEALRRGMGDAARLAFSQAEALLEMSSDAQRSEEVRQQTTQLRAQLFNELGVLHQRLNALEDAKSYHRRAIAICDALQDEGVEFRANAAATHLNLSSVVAADGDFEEAKTLGARAVELIEELREGGDAAVLNLAVGAYQNMALLAARGAEFDQADEAMEKSLAVAAEMVEAGQKNALPQSAQACQRISVLLFEGGAHDRALSWGQRAESYAEKAYESFGQEVLSIYVVSQINLISYNEQLGRFADAEDALWKGLEVSDNHVDILRRGLHFYENARKQADSRLEEGNLPREEVDEGLEDLEEIIEEIGGLPEPDQKPQPGEQPAE